MLLIIYYQLLLTNELSTMYFSNLLALYLDVSFSETYTGLPGQGLNLKRILSFLVDIIVQIDRDHDVRVHINYYKEYITYIQCLNYCNGQ